MDNKEFSHLDLPVQSKEINPVVKLTQEIRTSIDPKTKKQGEFSVNFGEINNMGVDKRIQTFDNSTPFLDVYKPLNSGKVVSMYDAFTPGIDNNERLAQNQSGWEQTINGLGKAGVNIGTTVLGNTAGFVYGLTDWAKSGNFSSVYDNSFSKTLDDWNTKLNYQLPNYYTKDQQNSSIFGKAATANFWANDVMNGLSFTVGTIASEAIWAYATGGMSLAARAGQFGAKIGQGARMLSGAARVAEEAASVARVGEEVVSAGRFGKAILGTEKAAEGLAKTKGFIYEALDNAVTTGKLNKNTANAFAKTGEILNTSRFIATSSGNEAGIEAFHYKKEAIENFYNNFERLNGRKPTTEEVADITNKIDGAANNVFMGNMAILGISNLAMMGNMFNAKLPLGNIEANINKKLFGIGVEKIAGSEVFTAIERKGWQKSAGLLYKGLSPLVREGIYEEGLQGVATKTANNWIEKQYNPKYLNQVSSIYDDAWKAGKEQYGTKAGWTEIGIGGIVGILGGFGTGEFSHFRKMAKEQGQIVAPSLNAMNVTMNTLVEDINAHRLTSASKVMASEEDAKNAKDAVTEKLAHNSSVIATLEMHNDPLFNTDFDKLQKHFNNIVDTTEVSQQEKDTVKEGFKNLVAEYKSADNFADSIVGSQGRIYGTNFQANHVKKALTHAILQGQTAKGIMDSSLEDMQGFMNSELITAIKNGDDLAALGKDKRIQVKNLSQQYKNWEAKSLQVQKEVQTLQATPNEIEGDKKSRLLQMQQKIIEIEDSKNKIRTELEGISKEISQNKKSRQTFGKDISNIPMTDDFIAVDDLINLDSKLTEVETTFKTLSNINPVSANAIEKHMGNYNKAKEALLTYNSAVKLIASGKFSPKIANDNPFSAVFNKFSKADANPNEYTNDLLIELNKNWDKSKTEYVEELQQKDIEKHTKILADLNAIEGDLTEEQKIQKEKSEEIIKDLSPKAEEIVEEKNDTPKRKETIQKELTTVEALKARIEDILKLFKSSFVGTYDVDEAVKNRPDKKDIERYRELLDQEPTQEFEYLKSKLSQWKVYDSLAEDEQSVADLLNIVAQLETEVEQQNTLLEPNIEDVFTEDKLKATETIDLYDLSVNTNFPVTVKKELDKRDKATGNYNITHMNPSSLLEKLGATDVKIDKKPMSYKEVDNSKKIGIVVTFMSGGISRKFTVADRGRLNITTQDFNAIPNVKTIESLTSWTYPNLYERDFEGNWRAISSDFSDPNITGDSNNLKDGDAIELFIDINNGYNQKLLGQKLESEELANQVVIYIKKGGEVYGIIKGIPNRDEVIKSSEHIILTLRDLAGEKLLSGESGIIASTNVSYVQLGNPILSINGDGTISQNPITKVGVKNIVTTGYVLDGEIVLNKKVEDVRRSFIKKITEKNKGRKIPIVVIKRGSQFIAFPIQMIKTNVSKLEDLNLILNNSEITDAQKVSEINNLLIVNGIAPKEFELITLDENKVNSIADRLDVNQEYKTADQLADGYKKENLVNDATIALDLENLSVSLPSQKFNIDMENLSYEDLPTVKVEKQEVLEKEAKKEDKTPKTVTAKKQVNKPKTAIKKHTVEFTIEDFQIKKLPKSLSDKLKKQTSKNKVIDYINQDIIALKKVGVVLVERNSPKKSKIQDAEEIADSIVDKITDVAEFDEELAIQIKVEEMKVSEDTLDKIAFKIFKSRLSAEDYAYSTEDVEEREAILSDLGYINNAVLRLKPKVVGVNKPSIKEKPSEIIKRELGISTSNLVSFETIDLTGKQVTYYKKGDKWGYMDINGMFDSLVLNAQPKIEKAYQAYKEAQKTEKEEIC